MQGAASAASVFHLELPAAERTSILHRGAGLVLDGSLLCQCTPHIWSGSNSVIGRKRWLVWLPQVVVAQLGMSVALLQGQCSAAKFGVAVDCQCDHLLHSSQR